MSGLFAEHKKKPEEAALGPGETFEGECVEFFSELVHALSVPRSVGQIYGLLFASPEPLSFTDIADRLRVSRGSVSQGLQALKSLGAIRTLYGDQDSRARFEPELGLRQLIGGVLREKVEPVVSEGGTRMARLHTLAGAIPDPAARKFSEQRVRQIEIWRGQTKMLLPLLKTILGSRQGG